MIYMKQGSRKRGTRLAAGFALVAVIPALVLCYTAIGPGYEDLARWEYTSIFLLTVLVASLGVVMVWSGSRAMVRLQRDMRSVALGRWDGTRPLKGEIDFLYEELSRIMARIEAQAGMIEEANRELEKKVEERTRQLISAERLSAVGEMAAGIAHEMNNIMMPIIGYAALLKSAVADEESVRKAEIIEECATRGSDIIRRLLTFARQDRSTFSRVDVGEVVRTIEKLMRPGLDDKGVKFIVRIEPAPPVLGNDSQLQQVFANLIINAQQAIKGPAGVIEVCSRAGDGYVEISVKDNGEGMDEERRREIFQPFFTTKGPASGTGLGLSISYGIITDHGGRFEVRSGAGQGSEITIYLPAMKEEREDPGNR